MRDFPLVQSWTLRHNKEKKNAKKSQYEAKLEDSYFAVLTMFMYRILMTFEGLLRSLSKLTRCL